MTLEIVKKGRTGNEQAVTVLDGARRCTAISVCARPPVSTPAVVRRLCSSHGGTAIRR